MNQDNSNSSDNIQKVVNRILEIFEKQIDSAEKRSDEEEVIRLRVKYESLLEGTRAYHQILNRAPFLLRGGEGSSFDSLKVAELYDLLWKSSEIQQFVLLADDFLIRGKLYALLGNYLRAIEEYNAAIILAPDWDEPYIHRISAYAESGDSQSGLNNMESIVERNIGDASLQYRAGVFLLNQMRYASAATAFDRAADSIRDDAELHYYRAHTYEALKDSKRAIESIDKAISLDKENAEYHLLRAQLSKGGQ